jgi:hypothetical protein
VLVSDSCDLSHALVLEKGMNLTEEVIEKQCSRLRTFGLLQNAVSIGLDNWEDLSGERVIAQVSII